MAVDLTKPLNVQTADKPFLEDLQGNILKGHGRDHTVNVFLHFNAAAADEAKQFIRELSARVVSTGKQFEETKRYKKTCEPGDAFVAFFLTVGGYRALNIAEDLIPKDGRFRAGLQNRVIDLQDNPVDYWDPHFQKDIHALLLIGDVSPEKVTQVKTDIFKNKPAAVTILGEEIGLAMRNPNKDGIEHFGYVDGRSQPLMTDEDILHETNETDGTHAWDPAFPLKQVLVPCKGGTEGVSFGSYFVFRKLEQDVKGFKAREDEIADQLGLEEAEKEVAGAMIVGRFEDGTPVTLQKAEGAHHPVLNNFHYGSDKEGLKCPFHAHIRKTNPRGESVGIISPGKPAEDERPAVEPVPSLADERSHIMARRGITYGERVWKNNKPNTELDENHFPSEGVGLLFMAYQSDIAKQFEFTQISWANNEGFVKFDPNTNAPLTGLDPVIGQGTPTIPLRQTEQWGKNQFQDINFGGFVKMKGGEYFYAPCISFLKNI